MSPNYLKAFEELIGNEGGYKCEATDRMDWTEGQVGRGVLVGTKFGISAGTYPHLDIKNLRLEDAKQIYLTDFWNKFQGDKLPYLVAFEVFDAEVNHGRTMGVRFLQRAVGAVDDGQLGPKTLAKIEGINEYKLLLRFFSVRLKYFTAIKTWDIYGKGWANRVAHNMLKASE